jgi:hypothetical protein
LLNNIFSELANLVIDGADNTGARVGMNGINVVPLGPSPSPGPVLDHVVVQNFNSFAIDVDGAGALLTINQGVRALTSNQGLVIDHKGVVVVNGGTDPIAFNQNTANGINVLDGMLTVNGVPSTLGNGSVQANGNSNGIAVVKPQGEPPILITGMVLWNNVVSGIDVLSGSPVKIRNSYILNNAFAGVRVRSNAGLSIASTDLGSAADGKNVLQDPTYPNGVGICIQATDTQTTPMPAQGNIFNGVDCSVNPGPSPSPVLTVSTSSCSGHADFDIAIPNNGAVDVTHCAAP